MERVQMCRICLVEDAPIYIVVNRKMHEVYEKLTNKQFVTEDRRPMLVCYFCCSRLKQCCRFQRQCLEAEVLFAQMLDEDYELNSAIKPDLGLYNGFIISPMELISIVGECQTESHVVKEEVPADCERLGDIIEPMEELQVDELELDNPDFSYVEDIPVHHSESKDESVTEAEEQDPNWAPVVKKAKLRKRRTNLEDVLTEEQKKSGQSESKVIRTTQNRTRKPRTGFKEPLIYTKRRTYICDICQRSYTRKHNLKRHIRIHTGEKPYKCEVCQYRFNDKSNLTNHIRIHTGEKLYKCELCQYNSNHKGDFKKHVLKHTNDKPYKCELCQYSCNQKHCLKRHLMVHTGEKPYKCEVCQRSFSHKSSLKDHIPIHTGEKPYKCDLCEYSCIQKRVFTNHIRIHTGEKLYKCELCQYSSNHNGDFKKHVLKHTNDKPYKCELCQYSCNQKHCLKRHLMVHTGEKPYKCEVCQRSFSQKSSLKDHMPIHTGKKPYKCDLCQYSCIQKRGFTKHVRMHTERKP